MKNLSDCSIKLWMLSFGLLLSTVLRPMAQDLTQAVVLRPGWNAFYLEVELAEARPGLVFTNVPITSLWTWNARVTSAQFIQHPNEQIADRDKWLVYFPPEKLESRFNNLFALSPRRCYLVKLEGTADVLIKLTGRTSLRQPAWTPNAYNLRGFPIDDTAPPTFREFFQYAKAHYVQKTGALQSIYRLSTTGRWALVQAHERMKRNEAYWVYSAGASDHKAPFTVTDSFGTHDGLDFGLSINELELKLHNHSGRGAVITVKNSSSQPVPLSYRVWPFYGPGVTWHSFPSPFTLLVQTNKSEAIQFGIRRASMTAARLDTLLEVKDNLGTLHYVPLSAQRTIAAGRSVNALGKFAPLGNATTLATDFSGLWLGTVTLTSVSEPHSGLLVTNVTAEGGSEVSRTGVSTNPTPAKSVFDLRLLVHVDTNGQSRLLREVTFMRQPAISTNHLDGSVEILQPGYDVLVTDPSLISNYSGVAQRGSALVGRRLSTVHFDFDHNASTVDLAGQFGSQLDGVNRMSPTMPTNPFWHAFHPSHGKPANAIALSRAISLFFSVLPPPGLDDPSYGHDLIAGTYGEQISGLHKYNIFTSGSFQLRRISHVGTLTPVPAATAPAPANTLQTVNR